VCRIVGPDAIPEAPAKLMRFLAEGHHAGMEWMARDPARRADPTRLWPDVRSIVMLGVNYAPPGHALAGLAHKSRGNISVYARGDDYHDVIKGRLKLLANFLAAAAKPLSPIDVKVFVDTAAIMEKPLAQAAGLGWQGKHTNLVSRDFGSWLFLGSIFTTLALPVAAPERDHCGRCRACLDICPTAAFPAPYRLDAGRCISYLTIEHKGPIPLALRAAIGNRIFGCDDCLAICPWNKFAEIGRDSRLAARPDLEAPPLGELAMLDEATFRRRFAGTPIKRIGRDRFVRNVLIAIGNSSDTGLLDVVVARLEDSSALVRGAAVWAAGRLIEPARLRQVGARRLSGETDASVIAEWHLILGEPA
jgi:epoxyqueuosine reductase